MSLTPLIQRLKKSSSFKGGTSNDDNDDNHKESIVGETVARAQDVPETDRQQQQQHSLQQKVAKRSSSLTDLVILLSPNNKNKNNQQNGGGTNGDIKPPPLSPLKRLTKKATSLRSMGKLTDLKITVDSGTDYSTATTIETPKSAKKKMNLNGIIAAMIPNNYYDSSLQETDDPQTENNPTDSTSSSNPLEGIFSKLTENNLLHTSELEPSKHQMMIPTIDEILLHARICLLIEDYSTVVIPPCTNIPTMFHLEMLCGLSRFDLERVCNDILLLSSRGTDSQHHHPYHSIITTLLYSVEDLTVEAYQCVGTSDEDLVDVSIFCSQRYRQFIVCYHIPQEKDIRYYQQQKRKPADVAVLIQQDHNKRKPEMVLLHPKDHPIPVNAYIREEYFANSELEQQVFAVLNHRSIEDPFMNVTFVGHGIGGALSKIAALRFAATYPAMTVSCHVFGTPRIGDSTFRLFANSLPNLKVMRIENGCDPYVRLPEDNNAVKWAHIGHTITIVEDNNDNNNNVSTTPQQARTFNALAYRFDDRRPPKHNKFFWTDPKKAKAIKERDHKIYSYVISLQQYNDPGRLWVTSFVGEEGPGISGIHDEIRCVV